MIQTLLVFLSTRIAGSPTPFWAEGSPPSLPKVRGIVIFSQVFPPSVLRLSPISICSCKSLLLLYLTSYTARSVPLLVVTTPGILKATEPPSPACLTPTPIRWVMFGAVTLSIGACTPPSTKTFSTRQAIFSVSGVSGFILILTQK